jgi:transposase
MGGRRTAASGTPSIKLVSRICCVAVACSRSTIPAVRLRGVSSSAFSRPWRRDRYAAGAVSAHGFASARGRLLAQTLDLLTTVRSRLPAVQRFAAHLTVEASALFTFLGDPAIDATNWRAEHAIRPAVAMRKVCGGNRSARGAHTQQLLASVLRTTHQRGLDPTSILVTLLRAPNPLVPLPCKHRRSRITR